MVLSEVCFGNLGGKSLQTTINFDFAGRLYGDEKVMILAFARVGITNKPVSGTLYKFDFYEDTNKNYILGIPDI